MLKYLIPVVLAAVGTVVGVFAYNRFLAGK